MTNEDERAVRGLYEAFLGAWNRRDADALAALFAEDGAVVGFDGSQNNSREEIASAQREIFANHPTAAFVGKIRKVRQLGQDAVLLSAVAGMVPPGQVDINPAVNTVHTVVAAKDGSTWRIAHFQSTPAAFHGRPEASEALTAELRELLPGASAS